MDTLCKQDEDRILAVLKKYYQVSHRDLKSYMDYKGNSAVFKRTMQKLVHEGHIKAVPGLGTLYWRYNIPITTVSRTQYKKALKLIETYTQQLEENQKEEKSIDHKFPKPTEILGNIENAGYFIRDFYLRDYTSNVRLLNRLNLYFLEYHDISDRELSELSIGQLPSISKKQFKEMHGVGKSINELLEQLCDRAGMEMLP